MARIQRPCNCSTDCDRMTGGRFAPGHDARLVSRLIREVKYAYQTPKEAELELYRLGGTLALADKLVNGIDRLRIRWEWVGETTLFSHDDKLIIHYHSPMAATAERSERLPPYLKPSQEPYWRLAWRTYSDASIVDCRTYQECIDEAAQMRKGGNQY